MFFYVKTFFNDLYVKKKFCDRGWGIVNQNGKIRARTFSVQNAGTAQDHMWEKTGRWQLAIACVVSKFVLRRLDIVRRRTMSCGVVWRRMKSYEIARRRTRSYEFGDLARGRTRFHDVQCRTASYDVVRRRHRTRCEKRLVKLLSATY